MKQRLAIAATLLKSPDLLILDEPTNGLDPAGIRDIRTMIRELGENGVTVLLSSHILAEVQQVCHSVSIIGNGRLLASGRGRGPGRRAAGHAGPGRGGRPAAPPSGRSQATRWTVGRDGDRLVVEGAEHAEDITRVLAGRDIYVRELTPGARRPGVGVPPADPRHVPARHRARRRRRADETTEGGAA